MDTLNDTLTGPDLSSRSLSSSTSNLNASFTMGAPSRRTSTISSSCPVLPRVESDCELAEPQTSLVGLLRDASERDELSLSAGRGRRKSTVSPDDLAKINLKSSSRTENMTPVVGLMRDTSMRDTSDNMDNSLYEVALPKKSPLHRQVQTRRQSLSSQQSARRTSTATTASQTSVTSASPMRRRSVVDPSILAAASLPKEAVVGPSSSATMKDVSEMDSSQLDQSLSRRRRRSVVSPEELAKVALHRTTTPDNTTPVVGLMRDNSERDSSQQIQIALPKKSPLLRQIQTRQSMVAAELKKATASRRASSAVVEPKISVLRTASGSQSPVRGSRGPRRKSLVSAEDLAKVNLRSSCTTENMTPVVGLMRDNSERDSSAQIQVALPKKSPLLRQIQTRQSMVAAEPNNSNSSSTTALSPAAARRRSTVSPEALSKALSGEQKDDSNHSSMNASIRRIVAIQAEELAKAGLGFEASQHSMASQHSIMSDSGHNMNMSMHDITAPVVEPMKDSSMRDTSMRDISEREMAANFEVPMPKKSPLHQQKSIRRSIQQSNGSSSNNNQSQARTRSAVSQEDIMRAGLLLRSSSKNSLGSLGEDSGYFTQTTIEEGDEGEETEEQAPKTKTKLATDSSALAGLRKTMAGHAANKYGIPLSHPSIQRSYTPPKTGSTHSAGSVGSSASLGSASVVSSVASVEDPDKASKKRLSFLRNAVAGAPSTSNSSSNVDNDTRIKVGLRNSRMSMSAVAASTKSVASTNSVDNDARIKAGLRNSRMSTSAATPSTQSVTSTNSVDNDTRIKAGLRSSRMSVSEQGNRTRTRMSFTENTPSPFMAAMARASMSASSSDAAGRRGLRRTSMPALLVGASASGAGAGARRASDQTAQDARIKAGLRHSTSTTPGAHASSDLSSSDARTKAGLRNSSIAGSTSMQDESSRSHTKCGLRSSQFGRPSAASMSVSSAISCASALSDATGCGGSVSTPRGLRRPHQGDADTDSKGSFGNLRVSVGVPSAENSVVDDSQPRPGAYRASTIQVEQQDIPVSIERVDSLRGSFLGREGIEEVMDETNRDDTNFSDEHENRDPSVHLRPRSDHFSMVSSLGDLDAQSTRTVPFGDATVEPIQESPKEDEELKGSQRKLLLCAIVAGILVLGIVGAVVGVVAGGGSSSSLSPPASEGEEGTDGATLPLDAVFGNLVTDLPADTIVSIQYGQASDPQVKAFKWLAADPNLAEYSMPQRKQRMALAAFYYATNGKRWFPEDVDVENSWLSYDSHECDWFSLATFQARSVCDTALESPLPPFEHFDYISLDLTGRDLVTQGTGLPKPRVSGGLIPELAMLSSLRRLDLSWNKLRGSIPTSIEPWLSSLEEIILFDNDLTGTIPVSLYWNARQLWLGQNDFEQSAIPPSIGSELTSLSLTKGNIVGTIPPQLFNPNLQELFLSENAIEGSIPTAIGTANLTVLQLQQNQLSSSLPTEIGLLTHCQVLRVVANRLTGTLPSQLGRLSLLHELMVSSFNVANKDLTGTIPQEFFVASSENNSSKVIPAFPNMMHLMLEDTQLSGSMPTQIGLMTNMVALYMGWNEMLGNIPTEVGLMTSMQKLSLQKSTLTSTIPSELGLLSSLGYLDLKANELTGDFPDELAALGDSLGKFFVDRNAGLEGTVPDSFCSISGQNLGFSCDTLCGCNCPCS